jgi:hypothetical protein
MKVIVQRMGTQLMQHFPGAIVIGGSLTFAAIALCAIQHCAD